MLLATPGPERHIASSGCGGRCGGRGSCWPRLDPNATSPAPDAVGDAVGADVVGHAWTQTPHRQLRMRWARMLLATPGPERHICDLYVRGGYDGYAPWALPCLPQFILSFCKWPADMFGNHSPCPFQVVGWLSWRYNLRHCQVQVLLVCCLFVLKLPVCRTLPPAMLGPVSRRTAVDYFLVWHLATYFDSKIFTRPGESGEQSSRIQQFPHRKLQL